MTQETKARPPAQHRRPGGPSDPGPAERGDAKQRRAGVGRLALLLLSPTMLALALVVGYPVLAALRLSLTVEDSGINPETGLIERNSQPGVDNYAGLFGGESSDRFVNALWNTTTFTIVTGALVTVL